MLTSRTMLCAEDASCDPESNQLSLERIVEVVSSPSFPLVAPRLCICALLERTLTDPRSFVCELHVSIGGTTICEHLVELDFLDHYRHRMILRLDDLPIPHEGVLRFALRLEGHEVAACAIPVAQPPA